ncbi:MAG: permease [Deltaproteobacteria bacterium]|nr:permease [Deltaproteobacteria bacterium]
MNFLKEIWNLTLVMAPYLLLGFLIAGVMQQVLPKDQVTRHLKGSNFLSIIKASLFGAPLPVCSCGVIPIAAHLKKQGASKGAVISFLGSTPTTGVDSIFATAALLGTVYAVFRPVMALVTGIFAGTLVNIFDGEKGVSDHGGNNNEPVKKRKNILVNVIEYALVDLIGDTGKWIVVGIIAGAAFFVFIPEQLIETWLTSPYTAYPAMLIVGIPLYVCATGSIPIAAAFILKGISPGAALIFLIAGPATNGATISFIGGTMGKKTLFAYLFAIVASALTGGLLLDLIWPFFPAPDFLSLKGMEHKTTVLQYVSAVILILSILWAYRPLKKINKGDPVQNIQVSKISCEGCASTIKKGLISVKGVSGVDVDVASKIVTISGSATLQALEEKLIEIGYPKDK